MPFVPGDSVCVLFVFILLFDLFSPLFAGYAQNPVRFRAAMALARRRDELPQSCCWYASAACRCVETIDFAFVPDCVPTAVLTFRLMSCSDRALLCVSTVWALVTSSRCLLLLFRLNMPLRCW